MSGPLLTALSGVLAALAGLNAYFWVSANNAANLGMAVFAGLICLTCSITAAGRR